jgi:hypothetical protein
MGFQSLDIEEELLRLVPGLEIAPLSIRGGNFKPQFASV